MSSTILELLISQVSAAYLHPESPSVTDPNGHTKLSHLCKSFNMSAIKVRKLLVTADIYEHVYKRSDTFNPATEILKMRSFGMSIPEIVTATGLSQSTVYSYLPYDNSVYRPDKHQSLLGDLDPLSSAAKRKQKQRNKETLQKELTISMLNNYLTDDGFWMAIQEHPVVTFVTAEGEKFTVSVLHDRSALYAGNYGDLVVKTDVASHIFSRQDVLNVLHSALAGMQEQTPVSKYVRPLLVYFNIIDGDRKSVTTKRLYTHTICTCCGRESDQLITVRTYSDLVNAGSMGSEKDMAINTAIQAFDDQHASATEYLCRFCAATIKVALEDGDLPSSASAIDYDLFTRDEVFSAFEDFYQKPPADKYAFPRGGTVGRFVHLEEPNPLSDQPRRPSNPLDAVKPSDSGFYYKVIDSTGVYHSFVLSYSMRPFPDGDLMIMFEANEIYKLTKARKIAKSNPDTAYYVQHLKTVPSDADRNRIILIGLLELARKVRQMLMNPTLYASTYPDGTSTHRVGEVGTLIPYYDSESFQPHGFIIDGKRYSGDEVAELFSSYEGWHVHFQVDDASGNVLTRSTHLMPVKLGEKELTSATVELFNMFTADGKFISDHDRANFSILFARLLERLKLYNDSNPRGYGKLAGIKMVRILGTVEGTEAFVEMVQHVIR